VQQGQGRRQHQQHGQRLPMAHRHEHRQGTQAAGTVHCERCNNTLPPLCTNSVGGAPPTRQVRAVGEKPCFK
jgi:hypothetical protein